MKSGSFLTNGGHRWSTFSYRIIPLLYDSIDVNSGKRHPPFPAIVKYGHHIRRLRITFAPEFYLSLYATYCVSVQELTIPRLYHRSVVDPVLPFLAYAPLRRFWGDPLVTFGFDFIRHKAFQTLTHIRWVQPEDPNRFSPSSLELLTGLPMLTHVYLPPSVHEDSPFVSHLLEACPRLQVVITSCSRSHHVQSQRDMRVVCVQELASTINLSMGEIWSKATYEVESRAYRFRGIRAGHLGNLSFDARARTMHYA